VIPSLLWRCPLCATHDALVHKRTFLRPDVVSCTACGARWRVRRIPGDDFYLRLDKPSAAHPMPAGREQPLTAWYDQMKSGLRLETIQSPQISLNPGENLYLALQAAELWTAADDPLATGRQADSPKNISLSDEDLAVRLGYGDLFLTNQRLAWQSEKYNQDFPLTRIQGAYAIGNLGLAIASGMRLVFFHFPHQSPLKWASYFSLVALQVQAETGRRIETTHW
jgi:hypothetical protein